MKNKFKSKAFEAIHSAVFGMSEAGTVDKNILRNFEEACTTTPEEPNSQVLKTEEGKRSLDQTD